MINGRIVLSDFADTISNDGDIDGSISLGDGADTVTNNVGATITAAALASSSVVTSDSGDDEIINDGTITATAASGNFASALRLNGAGDKTITNSGTIEQLSTLQNDAIVVNGADSLTLTNTGSITTLGGGGGVEGIIQANNTVSYTHLTLPTICSV